MNVDINGSYGETKNELPKGDNTIMFLCLGCHTYIKRSNVSVGDNVFDVNLAITCDCGHTFFICIKKEIKE